MGRCSSNVSPQPGIRHSGESPHHVQDFIDGRILPGFALLWGVRVRDTTAMDLTAVVLLAQGVYFFLTGLWPIIHMPSFLIVTGPKSDLWLVRTVGLLIAVAGAAMTAAGIDGESGLPILIVAIGSAAALAAVDIIYVALGTIAKIYLIDAMLELGLLAAWT